MVLTRTAPIFRPRTPTRLPRVRRPHPEALGCVVVRRITDDAGRAWRYVARTPGHFAYECTLHPTMQGTLVVR